MKLDRSAIIAIIFCFSSYVAYEFYLNKKYPDRFKPTVAQNTQPATPTHTHTETDSVGKVTTTSISTTTPAPIYNELSANELRIENDTSIYAFDQKKGGLQSITLKAYENDDRTGPINLLQFPLEIFPTSMSHPEAPNGFEATRSGNSITFKRQERSWLLTHTFKVDESGYGVSVDFSWKNIGTQAEELKSVVLMHHTMGPGKKAGHSFLPGMPTNHPFLVLAHSGDVERFDALALCKERDHQVVHTGNNFNVGALAFDAHYFVSALLPQNQRTSYRIMKDLGGENQPCSFSFFTDTDQGLIKPSEEIQLSYKAWFGPKSTQAFGSYDANLEKTIDLGFFAKITHPLLSALQFLYTIFKNWGLAIIALTVLLKLLFYPLTRQAAVSMHKMKKLQPEMNRIREKYKDEPQKMQQEIMRFMSLHKVNPMKGCLPILPQIPVFFAFYRVLSTAIELRLAPFFGWIHDLSSADPYYITPLILGLAMFAQQKLTPTTGLDKTQEKIMLLLPVFFTVMMLTLPAGMVLYMLTNTLISITQQQWLNRRLQ